MFFLLYFTILICISQSLNFDEYNFDYEIVHLPNFEKSMDEYDYKFSAFGEPLTLRLKKNKNLLSRGFKTYIREGDAAPIILKDQKNCHYLHRDRNVVASLSLCESQGVVSV